MKTASVRELRQEFPRILGWIDEGREVSITLRHRAVARLIPLEQKRKKRRAMPDLAKRLRRVFGDRIIADQAIKSIIDKDRGTY